ncbi:hypothetical protein CYMTET_12208 [Cymbomonas tetramitiformis]|uniref:Uncharacterized protein n=1 Tax=Cymbomonas tetramitiformis TaxID=36881 RepID=A0AAE0GL08_9CHLO|nr:hypothetical protein CYMTET_12208 [Cymbomonas tetramitiformis]
MDPSFIRVLKIGTFGPRFLKYEASGEDSSRQETYSEATESLYTLSVETSSRLFKVWRFQSSRGFAGFADFGSESS